MNLLAVTSGWGFVALVQEDQLRNAVLLAAGVISLVLLAGAVLVTVALRRRERDAAQIRKLNAELAHRAAVTQAVLDTLGGRPQQQLPVAA